MGVMLRDAMTPRELRRHIKRLNPDTPKHKALEHELGEGVGYRNAWYSSQKEHWLGWLAEYSGPGAYGRQKARSAMLNSLSITFNVRRCYFGWRRL